jgi:hypothetical protein
MVPWRTGKQRYYLSFSAADASLIRLCDNCLEILVKWPTSSCCDNCRNIIDKWLREKKTKPKKKQQPKSDLTTEVMKKNLSKIRKIVKFLEPHSGLVVKRNTIKISSKKNVVNSSGQNVGNGVFCSGCIEWIKHGLAHYNLNAKRWRNKYTESPRICIKQGFLKNPTCPKSILAGEPTYPLTWNRLFDTSGVPVGDNIHNCVSLGGYVRSPSRRKLSDTIALIDLACHETSHHKTKSDTDNDRPKGLTNEQWRILQSHRLDFQLKYKELFQIIINEVISGRYYRWVQ